MKKDNPLYIFNFIILISIFFGIAISAAHFLTLPMLKKNEALHRNRIIAEAFRLDVQGNTPEAYQTLIDKKIKKKTLDAKDEKIEVLINKESGEVGFIF